jgi:ATP/maltotriose-dependent transcriptional regulator MalT
MKTALPQLAKLRRPTISNTVERTQLFGRLDGCLQHPAVWVTGPAGAGKTTLASSYVEARRSAVLWYQPDEGDADPAQFFYYLGIAAGALTRKKRQPLPLLLVLDNYQTLPEESPLHDLITIALEEVPKRVQRLVLSPLPPLTRLQVNEKLCVVEAADLRMDEAEAAELIRLRAKGTIDESETHKLIERSQGWAAGLSLLIDQFKSDLRLSEGIEGTESQIVFDYFAGEIFRHMASDLQAFAMQSAFLPQIERKTVERLTGNQKGAWILADLTRRNFFTSRHTGKQTVYQYHHMFRRFLNDLTYMG